MPTECLENRLRGICTIRRRRLKAETSGFKAASQGHTPSALSADMRHYLLPTKVPTHRAEIRPVWYAYRKGCFRHASAATDRCWEHAENGIGGCLFEE